MALQLIAFARAYIILHIGQLGAGSFQELPDVIPEEWYYRQAEGSAAESLQPLSMHDVSGEETPGSMFPLSGSTVRTDYERYATMGVQGQDWKNELSRDGNYDRRGVDPFMFREAEEVERWFASLDEKHADVCATRPVLNFADASGSGVDAWDAWTGFSGGEMQWFVECSNLENDSRSHHKHARAPVLQCPSETCTSTDQNHAKIGVGNLRCDSEYADSSRTVGTAEE
jgi:hypothetical protein